MLPRVVFKGSPMSFAIAPGVVGLLELDFQFRARQAVHVLYEGAESADRRMVVFEQTQPFLAAHDDPRTGLDLILVLAVSGRCAIDKPIFSILRFR